MGRRAQGPGRRRAVTARTSVTALARPCSTATRAVGPWRHRDVVTRFSARPSRSPNTQVHRPSCAARLPRRCPHPRVVRRMVRHRRHRARRRWRSCWASRPGGVIGQSTRLAPETSRGPPRRRPAADDSSAQRSSPLRRRIWGRFTVVDRLDLVYGCRLGGRVVTRHFGGIAAAGLVPAGACPGDGPGPRVAGSVRPPDRCVGPS